MKTAFYDAKSYDKKWFSRLAPVYGEELDYLEPRLTPQTAVLARGARAVCAFVSDDIGAETVAALREAGGRHIALRSSGYNNVDLAAAARSGIAVTRVPAYSPSSVAGHAMALLLSLCRQTHRAYTRTRERNFSLEGLVGMDLKGRTIGLLGTGRVGAEMAAMAMGFGMRVIACDPAPQWGMDIEYVTWAELVRRADILSLHCPLTPETYHIVSRAAMHAMKPGVYIINTSRGALIDSEALLDMIKKGHVGAAGLDVYEEEADVFYEDVSNKVMRDDTLNLLLSQPNVLVTSHQAFLTDEALRAIAETTLRSIASGGKENAVPLPEEAVHA